VSLDVGPEDPMVATREHLIPKCLKKHGQQSLLVLAHRQCNMLRGLADAACFQALNGGRGCDEAAVMASFVPVVRWRPDHGHVPFA